jgi:hypothetical protein
MDHVDSNPAEYMDSIIGVRSAQTCCRRARRRSFAVIAMASSLLAKATVRLAGGVIESTGVR